VGSYLTTLVCLLWGLRCDSEAHDDDVCEEPVAIAGVIAHEARRHQSRMSVPLMAWNRIDGMLDSAASASLAIEPRTNSRREKWQTPPRAAEQFKTSPHLRGVCDGVGEMHFPACLRRNVGEFCRIG
jgi:hypothetical protein